MEVGYTGHIDRVCYKHHRVCYIRCIDSVCYIHNRQHVLYLFRHGDAIVFLHFDRLNHVFRHIVDVEIRRLEVLFFVVFLAIAVDRSGG